MGVEHINIAEVGLLTLSAVLAIFGCYLLYALAPIHDDLNKVEEKWTREQAGREKKINKSHDLRHIRISESTDVEALDKKALDYIEFIDAMNRGLRRRIIANTASLLGFIFLGAFLLSSSYALFLTWVKLSTGNLTVDIGYTILEIHRNSFRAIWLKPENDLDAVLDRSLTYWPTVALSWVGLIDFFAILTFIGKSGRRLFFQRWSTTKKRLQKLRRIIKSDPKSIEEFIRRKNESQLDRSKQPDEWWSEKWFGLNDHPSRLELELLENSTRHAQHLA